MYSSIYPKDAKQIALAFASSQKCANFDEFIGTYKEALISACKFLDEHHELTPEDHAKIEEEKEKNKRLNQ